MRLSLIQSLGEGYPSDLVGVKDAWMRGRSQPNSPKSEVELAAEGGRGQQKAEDNGSYWQTGAKQGDERRALPVSAVLCRLLPSTTDSAS